MINQLIYSKELAVSGIFVEQEQIEAKIAKVKKYMEYSRALGMVE